MSAAAASGCAAFSRATTRCANERGTFSVSKPLFLPLSNDKFSVVKTMERAQQKKIIERVTWLLLLAGVRRR
jgi:hypothetical protein